MAEVSCRSYMDTAFSCVRDLDGLGESLWPPLNWSQSQQAKRFELLTTVSHE